MTAPNLYAKQAAQYQRQAIETATPEEILIMLYDGAIRFLLVGRKAMEEKDVAKSSRNLIKAQHILMEFMNTLDMEIGGELAVNLYRLYEYLHYRLVQANIKHDLEMVDEVLGHLRKLKSTWEEAIRITQKEKDGITDEPSSLRA